MEGKGKGRLCFPLTEAESVPTTHNPHPLSLCPYTHTYPHTRSGSLKGTPNGSPARHSLLSFLLPGVSHTREKNVSSPPQNKMWAPYSGLGSPWGKAAGEPGPAHAQSWQRAPGPAGPWPRGGLGTRILQGTDGHILGFLERPRPAPGECHLKGSLCGSACARYTAKVSFSRGSCGARPERSRD